MTRRAIADIDDDGCMRVELADDGEDEALWLYRQSGGNAVVALMKTAACALAGKPVPEWCAAPLQRMVEGYTASDGDGDATLKAMGLGRRQRQQLTEIETARHDLELCFHHGRREAVKRLAKAARIDEASAERQIRRSLARWRKLMA